MITNTKFQILESQKQELEKKFGVPVFIDTKKEKLYIVLDNGDIDYVF